MGRHQTYHHLPSDLPAGYPVNRSVDIVLRDGSTLHVRPVLPTDIHDVSDFFGRVSSETTALRFHSVRHVSQEDLRSFVEVDYQDTFGLVAETAAGDEPRVVALGSYVKTAPSRAEVAVAVDDPFQGRGLGSILVEHLAEAASEANIECFEAEILSGNTDMIQVVRSLELPLKSDASGGVIHIEMPTSPTNEAIEAFERREAVAAAAGVARFLKPRSVAVIGASRRRGSISAEIFRNLLDLGFEGPVYPVNPKSEVVQSVPAYADVTAIPGPVDLAVIVVPASAVLEVAHQCGQKGVRALLVISAGFAEVGEQGRELQHELVDVARAYGMRILGPNCMGLMNNNPDVRLNATFAPLVPGFGRLAFSSQSGALGIAVMDLARELGLGLSSFVSVGNKADISGNDLLQYWEEDQDTDVILLYLESFGNPRKFARIARRVSKKKPIVAVKSGRSRAGARAAASHTASMAAGDAAVEALFHQAGVIRTDALEELFDVASLLATQPLPAGNRVAILTNAGGLGILAADACEATGLEIPPLTEQTSAALRALLADEASVANPVDMIASASADQYARALELLLADANVDSVIVIFIPPLVTSAADVANAVIEVRPPAGDKTVIACFMGEEGIHDLLRRSDRAIPSYAFPESAARALGRVAAYAGWRDAPEGHLVEPEAIDRVKALQLVARALEREAGWLDPSDVSDLLLAYGVPSVRNVVARSEDEVRAAAADIGGPVVVKVVSSTIVHKSDVGGVHLNLDSPDEAARAAGKILTSLREAALDDQIEGFLVQEMARPGGTEMFVGMTHDPTFGPLLACGAGGTLVELLRDVSLRITPLTDLDARDMLRGLKTWPLFEGYRGAPPLDAEALEHLVLRISTMVEDLPHIAELDLNPVLVYERGLGCSVVDARIRLVRPQPGTPRGARTQSRA